MGVLDRQTRWAARVAPALFAGCWLLLRPEPADAHTRITTNVTWSEDVRPILREKCMTCHHPGGIAPDYVDFTFYGTDVKPGAWAWRAAIVEEIVMGRMPPWRADPRFGSFKNSKALTQLELDTIVAWAEGGGPQGPQRDLPPPEEFVKPGWQFGEPDMEFELPEEFVLAPNIPNGSITVSLPVTVEKDQWITGFEFFPSDPKNIFSMEAWLLDAQGANIAPIEVEEQVPYDPLKPDTGPVPTRLREFPQGPHFLGQWVRGDQPVLMPDAGAKMLRKGSTIKLTVNYQRPDYADWTQELRDTSKLGLHVALPDAEIDLLVESYAIAKNDFVIKANEAKQKVGMEFVVPEAVDLLGVHPLLGSLGSTLLVTATYPDGLTQNLLWAPKYQRKFATSYFFDEPVPAPKGTVLRFEAEYNNTEENLDNPNSPPVDVKAGVKFTDEMLMARIDYSLGDHLIVRQKIDPAALAKAEAQRSGGGMIAGVPNDLFPPTPLMKDMPDIPGADAPQPLELMPHHGGEKIFVASNGFHRVEGTMPTPGEFRLYVYDDLDQTIDPRNFAGFAETALGATPLEYYHYKDDHLSAFVSPELPAQVTAALQIAGNEEEFTFHFDSLTADPNVQAPGKLRYQAPPHEGLLRMAETNEHYLEGAMFEPGKFRLYFYDRNLDSIDPRNFAGHVESAPSENKKGPAAARADLAYADPGDEYLSAAVPPTTPIALTASVLIGGKEHQFDFPFDELTEEAWDVDGEDAPAVPKKRLHTAPHGSDQFFAASNGFHVVEGAMPRPGEFRLYVYDDWKNLVGAHNVAGTVTLKTNGDKTGLNAKFELTPREDGGAHLAAWMAPIFPIELTATVTLAGKEESFDFSFPNVTLDPNEARDGGVGHMDHAPVHGGWQFFMADDLYHHVEGTMPVPGEFRAYFYDDYKQPLDPRSFAGKSIIGAENKETGEVTETEYPLVYDGGGKEYLTARLPRELPLTFYTLVWMGGQEKRFDFEFQELTVEPTQTDLLITKTPKPALHSHVRDPLTIPATVEAILEAVEQRNTNLVKRIGIQDWYGLYQPAFDAKDLVAALADKQDALDVRQRGDLKRATGLINRGALAIDRAGDSGDSARVDQAYKTFIEGLDVLRAIYKPKLK